MTRDLPSQAPEPTADHLQGPPTWLLACAEAAHEAVRIYCEAHGHRHLKPWARAVPHRVRQDAPFKAEAVATTIATLAGKSPFVERPSTPSELVKALHREVVFAMGRVYNAEAAAAKPKIEIVRDIPPAPKS